MAEKEKKSILHEFYVCSEWKPEPEYVQKPDSILPENFSALWRWLKFFGPKKKLIDSVTAHKENQQKWCIALGDSGKVLAVLTDNILEIRTQRSDYTTIASRTTVNRDGYPQWRKLVWSPDCSFLALAYSNGMVSFFDLTAANLFNIPADCSRPGGMECTDNTHAVAEIIFLPLRVKDNKWSWEVLIITFDGKLRCFLVSASEGFHPAHAFRFPDALACALAAGYPPLLYVATAPRADPDGESAVSAGLSAWRVLSDEPYYALSAASDRLLAPTARYFPLLSHKRTAVIVQMALSGDGSELACACADGGVSLWRLPGLRARIAKPLVAQPSHDLTSPFIDTAIAPATDFRVADINWWSDQELILSRFSGAVSVVDIEDFVNILGKSPAFFQGTPQVTAAHSGAFLVLECENSVLRARRTQHDDSMETVEDEMEESMVARAQDVVRGVLYALTELEALQPRPRRVLVLRRIYRLFAVRSTTPQQLFARKIEQGEYTAALALAESYGLDSDLVFQQQWRKTPVSTHAIQNYLSRVSKKIWSVHQCVDRLPETLTAAQDLLHFGLRLTQTEILDEINKDREEAISSVEDITLEHLNANSSELLRCRHIMLFYKQRLRLYEDILRAEKSSYVKDEYHRLRVNSIIYSATEIAKEARIEALTCLWPHIKVGPMQLAVLENIPETTNPLLYKHLLPADKKMESTFKTLPVVSRVADVEYDWCRKDIFRPIWSSNWSEDTSPEIEVAAELSEESLTQWYADRARQIEERSGLVCHALTLLTVGSVERGVQGLSDMVFEVETLSELVYEVNVEITLRTLHRTPPLQLCRLLVSNSTPDTFVSGLKSRLIPWLKRHARLRTQTEDYVEDLIKYLEDVCMDDLTPLLLVLQSPDQLELDAHTLLELGERCVYAHKHTHQLNEACDLLETVLKQRVVEESEWARVRRLRSVARACGVLRAAGLNVAPAALAPAPLAPAPACPHEPRARDLLAQLATNRLGQRKSKADCEKLLKDMLELQTTVFDCVSKAQCYEMYAWALLRSGEAACIKLAGNVLSCSEGALRDVPYADSVRLVADAAKSYLDAAASLSDKQLQLSRCCLMLIKDDNDEIQRELDLIAALKILHDFKLDILPIKVRMFEHKMRLIEECLQADPAAYLQSQKLLQLARLLRVDDDDRRREAAVMMAVGERALSAAVGVGARDYMELLKCGIREKRAVHAAQTAGLRLCALRPNNAAPLLERIAALPCDFEQRRTMLAAAAALCPPADLHRVLTARQQLERDELLKQARDSVLDAQWSEMFADALTTPDEEKKELVPADTALDDDCLGYSNEWYRSLYGAYVTPKVAYKFDDSFPQVHSYDGVFTPTHPPALHYLHAHYAIAPEDPQQEAALLSQCAAELLKSDTALSVCCELRARRVAERGADSGMEGEAESGPEEAAELSQAHICVKLYAELLRCNAANMRDNVYFAKPVELARSTVSTPSTASTQGACARLVSLLEARARLAALRRRGVPVDARFLRDAVYRREIILQVASLEGVEQVRLACELAREYGESASDAWLRHAAAHITNPDFPVETVNEVSDDVHDRIVAEVWPLVDGKCHVGLRNVFALLARCDVMHGETRPVFGLPPAVHIRLLKKLPSPELDYKVVVEGSSEQLLSHAAAVMRASTAASLAKWLRGLPAPLPAPAQPALYRQWLINTLFDVPEDMASSKKWMQQYRQCASYWNKLGKLELRDFVRDAAFSERGIRRIPASTRSLMVLQAADYCHQEQDNECKPNKDEPMTWAQLKNELAQWARFLDNLHSPPVRAIVDATDPAAQPIWIEIESSAGSREALAAGAGRLVLAGAGARLSALLRCLGTDLDPRAVLDPLAHTATQPHELELLACAYQQAGVPLPPGLERATAGEKLETAREVRGVSDSAPPALADCLPLLAAHWPPECLQGITEECLQSESGRRAAFEQLVDRCDTPQRMQTLVEVVASWPPTSETDSHSVMCELARRLLASADSALVRTLLRHATLDRQDAAWAVAMATETAARDALWLAVRCRHAPLVLSLAFSHQEAFKTAELDDALIKQLLDSGMFLELVPTAIYPQLVNYIVRGVDASYSVEWAFGQLVSARHLAEAGQLRMQAAGVPPTLRGFTQAVLYCTKLFSDK